MLKVWKCRGRSRKSRNSFSSRMRDTRKIWGTFLIRTRATSKQSGRRIISSRLMGLRNAIRLRIWLGRTMWWITAQKKWWIVEKWPNWSFLIKKLVRRESTGGKRRNTWKRLTRRRNATPRFSRSAKIFTSEHRRRAGRLIKEINVHNRK